MLARTAETKREIRRKIILAANTNSGRIHVVESSEGWAVKKEGAKRVSKIYQTKGAAIKDVKTYDSFEGTIIVHSKDGTFQEV